MKNQFSEYHNSITGLSKLIEQAGIGKNFHKIVFPELRSFSNSQSVINSILQQKSPLADIDTSALQKLVSDASKSANFSSLKFIESHEKLLSRININEIEKKINLFAQDAAWQKLIEPNSTITDALKKLQPEILTARSALDVGLTNITSQLLANNVFQNKPFLAKRLLEPSRAYTDFISSTAKKIELASSKDIVKALTISLHLTETQFLSATKVLSDFTTETDDNDDNVSSPRTLNLFDVQQEELISSIESVEQDEQFLIDNSSIAKLASKVRIILNLITKCNDASKISGRPEIFKPTNRMLEVFTDLPLLVASDKRSFADIVDCLYFIFYEGAGKDNLRFLTSNQGVLDNTECDFIWCVKFLRNKWLRHDADHGKQSQINKSWKTLSEQFNWLKLNHLPINQEHFLDLHYRLMIEAEKFLNQILHRLTINTL